MKHIKKFEMYILDGLLDTSKKDGGNPRMGTVNFSDLGDNWSPEFHLDPEINFYKKEFNLRGRKEIVKTIVDNINKLGESNYKSIVSDAKNKFYVNLPKFERAKEERYWTGDYGRQSIIIITLSALDSGVKKHKEKIQRDIDELKNKLEQLNDINLESIQESKMTFNEYLDELDKKFIDLMNAVNGKNGDDSKITPTRGDILHSFRLFRNYISSLQDKYKDDKTKLMFLSEKLKTDELEIKNKL